MNSSGLEGDTRVNPIVGALAGLHFSPMSSVRWKQPPGLLSQTAKWRRRGNVF